MPTYFHVAPLILAPGSIIEPGNWGRVLGLTAVLSQQIYRETVLEAVRQELFPDKPSRLKSFFALESLADAIAYRNQNGPTNLIYEVEIESAKSGGNMHRGNYDRVQDFNAPVMQSMKQCAVLYWTETPTEKIEIVIELPATIVRQCS